MLSILEEWANTTIEEDTGLIKLLVSWDRIVFNRDFGLYPLSIIGLQDIFTLAICYASLGSFLYHHFATHEHYPPHQTMDHVNNMM